MPISVGRVPIRFIRPAPMNVMVDILPTSVRSVPPIFAFRLKETLVKLVKRPNSVGIVPDKLFSETSSRTDGRE